MAYNKNYNNNNESVSNTTYSGITPANPKSNIQPSKLSIGYFNKVMKISIALKNADSNESYATYDYDNALCVYVNPWNAKILYDMIQELKTNPDMHNVCIEVKNGLLLVSDGSDYGSENVCISISTARNDGTVSTFIYETKSNYYGAYNYSNGEYQQKQFKDIELDTFEMALLQYYNASSYAIAASIQEANMYKRQYTVNMLKAIAGKIGVQGFGNNNDGGSKFLNSGNGSQQLNNNNSIPTGYDVADFDDLSFDGI